MTAITPNSIGWLTTNEQGNLMSFLWALQIGIRRFAAAVKKKGKNPARSWLQQSVCCRHSRWCSTLRICKIFKCSRQRAKQSLKTHSAGIQQARPHLHPTGSATHPSTNTPSVFHIFRPTSNHLRQPQLQPRTQKCKPSYFCHVGAGDGDVSFPKTPLPPENSHRLSPPAPASLRLQHTFLVLHKHLHSETKRWWTWRGCRCG